MSRLVLALTLVSVMILGLAPFIGSERRQANSLAATGQAAEPGDLASMLTSMPALPLGDPVAMVSYANIERQVKAVGVEPLSSVDEISREWVAATQFLQLPISTRYMALPEWLEIFGFDLSNLDQTLEYAAPPRTLTIYRGRFEPDRLIAAWEGEGYRPVTVNGATIYTIRDDLEMDLQSKSSRMALGRMNHATIIDETTIVFGGVRDDLEATLAAFAGAGPSMADDVGIAPMLSELPSDLVSALVVPGQMLAMQGDEAALWRQLTPEAKNADALATQIAETTIELQRMPPIVSAILGITAGGAVPDLTQETPSSGTRDIPVSRLVVALTMIHMDAATTGAEVVADRLAHGSHPPLGNLPERPYRDVFADYEVRVASAEPVITITLTPAPGISPTILFNLLFTRALTFVGWSL